MPTVTYIQPNGAEHRVEAPSGISVMLAAVRNDVPGILAECGGSRACGTCHVYVDEAWRAAVGGPGAEEAELIAIASVPQPESRLSCQIVLSDRLDGLVVRLPQEQP